MYQHLLNAPAAVQLSLVVVRSIQHASVMDMPFSIRSKQEVCVRQWARIFHREIPLAGFRSAEIEEIMQKIENNENVWKRTRDESPEALCLPELLSLLY